MITRRTRQQRNRGLILGENSVVANQQQQSQDDGTMTGDTLIPKQQEKKTARNKDSPSLTTQALLFVSPTTITATCNTTSSSSSSSPNFIFQGVTYDTYQDMVKAKRAFNQKVLEQSGLLEASANFRKDLPREGTHRQRLPPPSQRGLVSSTSNAKRKNKGNDPTTTIRRKSSRIAGIESDGMFIEEERIGGKVIIGGMTQHKKETGEEDGGNDVSGLYSNNAHVAFMKEENEMKFYNNRVNDGSDLSVKDAVELTGSKWVQETSVGRAEMFMSKLSKEEIVLENNVESECYHNGNDDDDDDDDDDEPAFSQFVQHLSMDAQECVAKVVPERIYSVAFHPCSHKLIATAGDKKGYLGLWDVDATCTESNGGSNGDMDGVYLFKPHSGAINSLEWNKSGSKLLSQSYDGTIRLMDVQKQIFLDAFAAYDDSVEFKGKIGYGMDEGNKYYTQFACYDHRNEDCIFLSTSLGGVVHLDLRSKANVTWNLVLSDKKINSLR
jgi:WD domain, G-beta repeat.